MTEDFVLKKLLSNKNITKDQLSSYINNYHITYTELIKKLFRFINNVDIKTNKDYVLNAVSIIVFISSIMDFKSDEVDTNINRIKKTRDRLLLYLNNNKDSIIRLACNKLDEIALYKALTIEDIKLIIKNLIDKNEDTGIIKKILSINKECILDGNLFDYVFNKTICSLDSYLITYYITLLKLFYCSAINKEKYIGILNQLENNELTNEIYSIIFGDRRSLGTNEIVKKYNKGIPQQLVTLKPIISYSSSSINSFTIDGYKTLLKDDALSIRKDGNKYIVGIHISDLPSYTSFGSEIDIRALHLYKNSYLLDKKIELYTDKIGDSMSLIKSKYKPCLSLYVVMLDSGDIIDYHIASDNILISDNYNYAEIDEILDMKTNPQIVKLFELSLALRKKSKDKEQYWKSKESSRIYERMYSTEAHLLVGEFAVLYNKLLAEYAYQKNYPFIYRAQDKSYLPNLINELNITPNSHAEVLINSIYLEGYYSIEPKYHYGLQEAYYSQSSSPLRRYTDSYNQRLIHKYDLKNIDFDDKDTESIIDYMNIKEFETRLFEEEYNRAASLTMKRRN